MMRDPTIYLQHALLTQICWSDEGSISMRRYCADAARQVLWAGDNFCITTPERMPPGPARGREWKDVSTRVDTQAPISPLEAQVNGEAW